MDINELIEKLEGMRDEIAVNGARVNVAILNQKQTDEEQSQSFFSIGDITAARYIDSGYEDAHVIWLHMGRY